jgi:glucose-6-phosphate isomerase
MPFPSVNPVKTNAWKALQAHFEEIRSVLVNDLFDKDKERFEKSSLKSDGVLVDFSKNRITSETMDLLLKLAEETKLEEAIQAFFSGEKINQTENRAVLHSALRNTGKDIFLDGKNISEKIKKSHRQMKSFSDALINGSWKGYSGKEITDVVNIGIGGSDLGPRMVVEALKHEKTRLNLHFISNIDGDHVFDVLEGLNPETTLFIVVSKSFSTQETLTNAKTAKSWFTENTAITNIEKHFVAVSTNIDAVEKFGIDKDNIFPMWDWVGGRFSLWGTAGLSICCAIGFGKFEELLSGAESMDKHFRESDFKENIPVMLALLGIWYANFFKAETEAVVPYNQSLEKLVPYLQQASMESNGKSVDRNGDKVAYQTGSVVWGAPGTNAQHAFFQLLHQGTKLVPVDFIGFKKSLHGNQKHHKILMANFFAQTEALLKGKTTEEARQELQQQGKSEEEIEKLLPYKTFEGNKPSTTILFEKLSPENLGKLIAMYEHKIFVQGVLWNIFSFDQWGVEYGKQLAKNILSDFDSKGNVSNHDASTDGLLREFES